MTAPPPAGRVRTELRRLVPSVYVPVAALTLGVGIMVPIVPLYLEDAGVGLSLVGVVIGVFGVGAALAGLPASVVAERTSNDHLLALAIAAAALGAVAFGATEIVVVLLAARVVGGLGYGSFSQSRQLFVAREVPIGIRGRVTSLMGGTHRLAMVLGPILGGAVADTFGYRAAFALSGIVMSAGLAFWILPGGRETATAARAPERVPVARTIVEHRTAILRGGFGPLLIMAGREGRYVVIPLIAVRLGLSVAEIGGLLALGTVVDFLLFPLSGVIMDRFGRLNAIVPAFTLMAIGLVLLGLAESATAVAVASVLIGGGNGLTSGAVLTLGADLAPLGVEGPFLAGFNLVTNLGLFVGPFLVGAVAARFGLDIAAFTLGAVLIAGVAWIAVVVGETGRRVPAGQAS